jgi:hypothetical protein
MVPPFIAGALSSSATPPLPETLITPGSIRTVEAYMRERKAMLSATSFSREAVAPIWYLLTRGASEVTVISSAVCDARVTSTSTRAPLSRLVVRSFEPMPSRLAPTV